MLVHPSSAIDNQMLWEYIFHHDAYGAYQVRRFRGDRSHDPEDHSPLGNEKWFSRRGTRDWLDYQIEGTIRYSKQERENRHSSMFCYGSLR
jgi:hypothetical protein